MTFENRKKRYDFYVKNGDTERAEELALKYPDVKATPEPTPEPEEKPKSKGKK